jgi:hypothetical protein
MTNPDSDPTAPGMPGIRDYLITLPFHRTAADGAEQTAEVRMRIPASSSDHAFTLGTAVGWNIDTDNTPDGDRPWHFDMPGVAVEDVDDTPSMQDLAAELEHHKRILAGLATKMPLVLQLSADEYNAADPDSVQAIPVADDVMAFVSTSQPFPVDAVTGGMQTPGSNPELHPLEGRPLPEDHGGYPDPDVRLALARTLARALVGQVEILVPDEQHNDVWNRLGGAFIDHEQGLVFLNVGSGKIGVNPTDPIPTRPATIDAYGSDLVESVGKRQVLTGTGWMDIERVDWIGEQALVYKVTVAAGDERRQTSFDADEQILLRDPRPEWWS